MSKLSEEAATRYAYQAFHRLNNYLQSPSTHRAIRESGEYMERQMGDSDPYVILPEADMEQVRNDLAKVLENLTGIRPSW